MEEKKKAVAVMAYSEPLQKESPFQDPPSPSTENLSKLKISTSAPINTSSLVLNQIDSDTPMTEPIFLNNSGSEPNTSENPISEPLISELTTQPIPLAHLENSGNEILISDVIPVITLPSEDSPSSAIILHQPIPNNLEECIDLFRYDALIRIHELRTSACPHPVLVRRAWEDFRRWLDQSVQNIAQMAESTKQTEILAAAERRIQYEFELAARMAARKKTAEEKAALEAAEKAEFLSEQAEIEQAMLEREELEREEAEKAEALMLAEKKAKELEATKTEANRMLAEEDAIRAEAMKKQQAEDQRLASEQAEKNQSENAEPGATSEAS